MKSIFIAAITALLLLNGAIAHAEGGSKASQAQTAVDTFQNMSPEQRDQMIHTGVDQVEALTPEQMKEYKAMFDSLSAEERAQMEAQIQQSIEKDPKLKAAAEKKLNNLTPEQRKQLESK